MESGTLLNMKSKVAHNVHSNNRELRVELMTDETTMNWEKVNELPVASTVLPTFHYLLKSLFKNLDSNNMWTETNENIILINTIW